MPRKGDASLSMTTKRAVTRYLALAISGAAVFLFYAWAVAPDGKLFAKVDGGQSYYNLLVKGFRSGRLSLAADVPPALLALKDPYDPKQNAPFGMHDASYYKGRFYLYFGAAPAVGLYWPFAALTGRYLEDRQAIFVFASLAFLAGAALLLAVKRRHFPGLGIPFEVSAVLAMGFTSMVPVLLRRQEVYEAAVSSANAFFMIALLLVFVALGRRSPAFLALASLSYGFAIASRPTYAVGVPVLLVPWVARFIEPGNKEGPFGSLMLALLGAAVAPVGLMAFAILAYNDLRFGNPFEFGINFAFSGSRESANTQFSLAYVWYNCRAYLWAPAHLSTYFPFVRVPSFPPGPKGYEGVEDPYGIMPNIPFVLLALASPLSWKGRSELGVFTIGVAASSGAVAAGLLSFVFASNRYMVDFLPGLVIVAVIGFWALAERVSGPSGVPCAVACWLMLVWSIAFNVFAACGHNEYLRIGNPALFRRLVHAFDYPRHLVDRLRGKIYGPLELSVVFPSDRTGRTEPLIVTGSSFLSDYLYVHYLGDGILRLGIEHTSFGGPISEPIHADFSQPHKIVVDLPALYPPSGDPYFDRVPADRLETFFEHLSVVFDGRTVIDTVGQSYPAFRSRPEIGTARPDQSAFGRRFTGKILRVQTLDRDWTRSPPADVGPLVINMEFPSGEAGVREPLVSSGFAGKGDLLVVSYQDRTHVIFTLDHWGYGGPSSTAVAIKPGNVQVLEIRFGSFYPPGARPEGVAPDAWSRAASTLKVALDGKTVFDASASFYDSPGETVAVGRNAIGASGCAAEFRGRILSVHRGALP